MTFSSLAEENTQLACCEIANVESADRMVRFEYNVDDVRGTPLSLWLADATAAARLVQTLKRLMGMVNSTKV